MDESLQGELEGKPSQTDEASLDIPPVEQLAQTLRGRQSGLFITFEGGDGVGKSTQIARLAEALRDFGLKDDLIVTFEPGATELGAALRRLIQHGPEDVDPRTEALLYAADRSYHVATVVRPALEAGKLVLQDRYIDSSVAYQGAARQLGPEEIEGLSLWGTGNLTPDVTVLFDMDTEAGLARVGGEPDRMERAGLTFHEAVGEGFLQAAKENPGRYVVVDASGSIEEVFERVVEGINQVLASQAGGTSNTTSNSASPTELSGEA